MTKHEARTGRLAAARSAVRAADARRSLTRYDHDIRRLAYAVQGVQYGPSECRPEDRDAFRTISHMVNGVTVTETVPVLHVATRNSGILATLA